MARRGTVGIPLIALATVVVLLAGCKSPSCHALAGAHDLVARLNPELSFNEAQSRYAALHRSLQARDFLTFVVGTGIRFEEGVGQVIFIYRPGSTAEQRQRLVRYLENHRDVADVRDGPCEPR